MTMYQDINYIGTHRIVSYNRNSSALRQMSRTIDIPPKQRLSHPKPDDNRQDKSQLVCPAKKIGSEYSD